MSQSELTTLVEESDDPAKQLGSLESWSGQVVFALRDTNGHFVTWRKADEQPANTQAAVATDGGRDSIEWTTDSGSDVTVTADNGTLFVTLEGSDETGAGVSFERQRATLTRERNTDVLDCGKQCDDSGERFRAFVPLEVDREEIEQLRAASEPEVTDEPVVYTVEEYTRTTTAGGWGKRETTKQRLSKNKQRAEMTDRQKELHSRVNTNRPPDGFEEGDELIFADLLDDARTREERDQEALDEAAETGEEVVINRSPTDCNDPNKECSLDWVSRVATPDGEIENRRTHTY